MHLAAHAVLRRLLTVIDIRSRLPGHIEEANTSLVQTKDGVVDQRIGARHDGVDVDHRRAPRRHRDGLNEASRRRDQIAISIDFLKYAADQVECRRQIGPCVAEVDPNVIASHSFQRTLSRQRTLSPIEYDCIGSFVQTTGIRQLHCVGWSSVLQNLGRLMVEFALHDVILSVHGSQGGLVALRLDQHQTVHSIRDVHRDGCCGTMIHEQTGIQQSEPGRFDLVFLCQRQGGYTSGTFEGMTIDVVRVSRGVQVRQRQLYDVADSGSYHGPRDAPIKVPSQYIQELVTLPH
jgi:hypothetical protein